MERKSESVRALLKAVRTLLLEIIVTAALMILMFTMVIGITVQNGNDMYPAVRDGDMILYFRLGSLLPTEAVIYEHDGELKTGRIACGPGSEISCTNDERLTVDGIMLIPDSSQGIYSETYTARDEVLPEVMKEDCYFILNDDRTRTDDSREYGAVHKDDIRGRIITVLRRRLI